MGDEYYDYYKKCCDFNCDFCLGSGTTRDCILSCTTFDCKEECCRKCFGVVVPVVGVGGFYACKECNQLMKECAGCMYKAGADCNEGCKQFKKNMEQAIEKRRQEREAQLRARPLAENIMNGPPVKSPPQALLLDYAGGKKSKSKSKGLRRRKSKSNNNNSTRGLIRRKSKSKSRGLRRRKSKPNHSRKY